MHWCHLRPFADEIASLQHLADVPISSAALHHCLSCHPTINEHVPLHSLKRLPKCCSVSSNPAGARVLRQDPVECLFEFICSSNNHISRIHGMVERLCRDYGTPLSQSSVPKLAGLGDAPTVKAEGPAEGEQQQKSVPDLAFYAFPSLEQLSAASDALLRAEGFGYRYAFESLPCNAATLHTLVESACRNSVTHTHAAYMPMSILLA